MSDFPTQYDLADIGCTTDIADVKILDVIRRICLSALVAIPSAFFSFGLADSSKTPELVRYLIAPGYEFGLHVRMGFDSGITTALVINTAYYTLIIFLISRLMDAFTAYRSLNKTV